MAKSASGAEVLEQAQRALRQAKTAEELRQAQAVVLPLQLGLSIEQTAQVLGVSKGWACQLRRRFIAAGHLVRRERTPEAQRQRARLTLTEEAEFLAPFFEQARGGQILIAAPIQRALEARLGRRVALTTVYNLLHRHGWRKLAPDRIHPLADPALQERWKKKPENASP
jgi:transposase